MTAVEFIVEKLTPFNWTKEQMQEHYKDAIQQAKEMEKEQIGYSEEDVRKAILFGQGMELWKEEFQINGFIQSLQQKHELNKSE